MRMLSLAVFAVLALTIGAYEENGMTILIGVVSALAAVASLPRWDLSTFLTMLSELFVAETVIFGVADLVALTGNWPKAYEEYELPTYLPLATAIFILAIFGVSHFGIVKRMMRIADPFFAAQTPISIRPWPLPRLIARQDVYARINVWFLILINQFQVALGLRFNFFQRDFGNAIQVADEAHRTAFWEQLITVFVPLAFIAIVAGLVEFFVASNFVLQWRRWMTASFTSRWLTHSMHYKLALGARPRPTTPTSASRRTSAASSTAAAPASIRATRASTTIRSRRSPRRPTWCRSRSSCGGYRNAMRAPIFGVEIPGLPVLGRRPLRRRRHRHHASHRPQPYPDSTSASRRWRRTSASIWRASANTASRSRSRRARTARSIGPETCSPTSFTPSSASSTCAPG